MISIFTTKFFIQVSSMFHYKLKFNYNFQTMRFQLDQLLEHKITNPGPTDWDQSKKEGAILDLVLDMLTSNTTTS